MPIEHFQSCKSLSIMSSSPNLWHQCLAHTNPRVLPSLHKHVNDVPKLSKPEGVCRVCRPGKAHKPPFAGHFEVANQVFEIFHSNIIVKLEPSFSDRYRYVSTFLNEKSLCTFIGLMQHRNDIHGVFDSIQAKFQ